MELYHHPVNRFVADFIGSANFLEVRRVGRHWQLADGTPIQVDPVSDAGGTQPRVALLRPEAVRLDADTIPDPDPTRNRLTGFVLGAMYLGPHIEYVVSAGGAHIRAFSRLELPPGSPVTLSFDASDCRLVDDTAASPDRTPATDTTDQTPILETLP